MAKTLIGTVTSVAPDKTAVVAVNTRKTHPIYKKQYIVTRKFMAHDEENSCKVGDRVSIIETRPISARKRFKLEKILEHAALTKEDLKAIEDESKEVKEVQPDKEEVKAKTKPVKKTTKKADKEAEETSE
jgi:small subunit ribosomal protein S17